MVSHVKNVTWKNPWEQEDALGMQSHKRTNGEPWNTCEEITQQQQQAHI
jgi:hypothetical protein